MYVYVYIYIYIYIYIYTYISIAPPEVQALEHPVDHLGAHGRAEDLQQRRLVIVYNYHQCRLFRCVLILIIILFRTTFRITLSTIIHSPRRRRRWGSWP